MQIAKVEKKPLLNIQKEKVFYRQTCSFYIAAFVCFAELCKLRLFTDTFFSCALYLETERKAGTT